jgi:hypothetical protein
MSYLSSWFFPSNLAFFLVHARKENRDAVHLKDIQVCALVSAAILCPRKRAMMKIGNLCTVQNFQKADALAQQIKLSAVQISSIPATAQTCVAILLRKVRVTLFLGVNGFMAKV